LSIVKEFVKRHPLVLAWLALSLGMVTMLVLAARGVGLQPGQMAALIVSTIGLAGVCIWIISWE
jgi:thiamine transporter ThiT